jgi:copper chaperone CopZ
MAGPATNVATIGAVYRVFGARTLAIYLGDIVIGSILCAVAFDWLLTAEAIQTVHQHERPAWWAVGSALIVLLLIVRFAVDDLRRMRRRFGRGRQAAASRPGYKVAVQGMTCNACVNRLEKALGDVDGVESTEVQLHPGQAIVYGSMDDRDIRAAIEAAGFEPQEASAV